MATPGLYSADGLNRRRRIGLFAPIAIAALLTFSLLAFVGTSARSSPALPTALAPHSPLTAAEDSLEHGYGPAGGAPMACSAGAGDTSCSSTAASPAAAGGSAGWANITGLQTTSPIPRSYGRSMAYDPVDHYVVLFGGYTDQGYIQDTWTFANGTWTQLNPVLSPSDRDHSTFVWDPTDGYLLLFGGSGNGGQYGDTWSFLSGSWTQHSPTNHPSGRWSASMAWDTADGYAVLFGGCNSDNEQNDTWTYLNGTWTELFPANHPSNRGDAGMTYDPSSSEVVLFGGYDGDSSWAYFNDTWTFHAGNWTQVNTLATPSARTSPAFAYDPWLGGVVLFGGEGPTEFLSDTWLFSNGSWTQLPTSNAPAPREFGIMATDPGDGYLLLFGGEGNVNFYNDTWAFYTMNASARAGAISGEAPFRAGFQGAAVDPYAVSSFGWTFGDGGTASGADVNHTFDRSGTYLVTLTATDVNGVAGVASLTIIVSASLSLVAVASATQGTIPFPVEWAALASGGVAPYYWNWSIGGVPTSTLENFSYTFSAVGDYQVVAALGDSSGARVTETFEINATAPTPVPLRASVLASVVSGEAPLVVSFSGFATGGVLPYSTTAWQFGDGTTGSGWNTSHSFNFSGNFTVTFRVVDSALASSSATVEVVVAPALSVLATASTTGGAAPINVTFDATASGGLGPYYFLWQFGDGMSGTGGATFHSYDRAGTFVASVEVVDSAGHTSAFDLTVLVTPGTTHSTPTPSSGGTGLSFDTTAVLVAAELVLGGVAVAAIVIIARR
ncbi:MAG: PKD domain-containing protein, partial [Thermoplasmata archaeon]|nr:PKD domain-containing protein [Thermoplasmata archaeon]